MITRKYFNEEAMFWIHTFTLKLCRIQGFMDQDPDPDILENVTHESSYYFYGSCSTFILRTPSRITKLQGKPPALSKDSAALQNMISLFLFGHTRSGSEFRIRESAFTYSIKSKFSICRIITKVKQVAVATVGTVQNEQSMGTWLR